MKALLISAVSASALIAFLGGAEAKTAKAFIEEGIQGDTAEVMMGKLAGQKGVSGGVKQFGETLVDDHSKAKNEKIAVAQKIGATIPTGPSKDAQAEYDKLSKLSGADFDREFITHMTMDHQKDIKEFEEEAKAGHNETSNLAMMQLPTLKKHLTLVEALGKTANAH
jgi:putative membrane protein